MALEYNTPGVYIQEIQDVSVSMTAAPTNVVGFIGETKCGNLNVPTLVTSFSEYFESFVGYTMQDKVTPRGTIAKDVDGNVIKENIPNEKTTDLDWSVYAFFANGGGKCYIVSVNHTEDNSESIAKLEESIVKVEESTKDKKVADTKISEIKKEIASLQATKNIDKLVIGSDGGPSKRKGIACFKDVGEISILCAPGITSATVLLDLISYAEATNRFAIVDAPLDLENLKNYGLSADLKGLAGLSGKMASKQVAVYFPWINVDDNGKNKAIAPSGFMAGVYARVDEERGVHKAPANVNVKLAKSLTYNLSDNEQEELNKNGINCIRNFSNAGIKVWGARTSVAQIDPQWKYINVRRLFNMIEKSIEEGTNWAVFEPNDSKLWGSLTRNTKAFLSRIYNTGALAGNSESEAYFVKCDASNNSQENIDAGVVNIEVGIAPVKPAEFIVFKISQKAHNA